MMYPDESIKQECLRIAGEVSAKHEELEEMMKCFLPIGRMVSVQRGRGIWEVEVVCVSCGMWAGYFRAKSRNGKVHTFYYEDVLTDVESS